MDNSTSLCKYRLRDGTYKGNFLLLVVDREEGVANVSKSVVTAAADLGWMNLLLDVYQVHDYDIDVGLAHVDSLHLEGVNQVLEEVSGLNDVLSDAFQSERGHLVHGVAAICEVLLVVVSSHLKVGFDMMSKLN